MHIAPFRPLRYDPRKISFISRVVAPPYDVIDPGLAADLRARDPHNAIRLVLGKAGDGPRPPEQYREAAATLAQWRRDGVLIREERPAVYPFEQAFELGGETCVRRGVLCALLLDDSPAGRALPHEGTLAGPRADRWALMSACKAGMSAVFGFFSDPDGRGDGLIREMGLGGLLYEFQSADGVTQKLRRECDPERIARLSADLRERTFLIADGHHRFRTAMEYRDRHRNPAAPPGTAPEDYVMAYCVSVADPGLRILPTHRLARAEGDLNRTALLETVGRCFELERIPLAGAEALPDMVAQVTHEQRLISLHLSGQEFYACRPKQEALAEVLPARSAAWRSLPVAWLHYAILAPAFGIPAEPDAGHPRLVYSQDLEEMYWSVESGEFHAGFYVPPTRPSTVEAIARAGETMPPKSTYFYPKIDSGLLIYPFERESAPDPPTP